MKRTLILGYGNPDREDDGAAWHILAGLARKLGRDVPVDFFEGFPPTGEMPELVFVLQLAPEMAETLSEFERVCLVDAHTGYIPEELRFGPIDANFQTSPFTHHMTPQSLLSFVKSLYGVEPEAVLVSVRGYSFGFSNTLSPRTERLAEAATERIWQWINN